MIQFCMINCWLVSISTTKIFGAGFYVGTELSSQWEGYIIV